MKKDDKLLTIFVTDIRNFSSVASVNSREDLGYFLDQYIALISSLVQKYRSREEIILDNFLGDGFLIFFENALTTIEMTLQLRRDFKNLRIVPLNSFDKLGVSTGIHRGVVYYGTYGYGDIQYLTGVSHHVNMAFRLAQEATKWEILVSKDVQSDIDRKTINTCKDRFFPKGGTNAIWPYSVSRLILDQQRERRCCDECKRIKFCHFSWQLGNTNKEIDPYFLVPEHSNEQIKYKFTKKMLCAFPTKRVVPDIIPSLAEGICGGCDPLWKNELPKKQQAEPTKECKRNILRGYHKIEDRECCGDCMRYNTCLFNLHRGKNNQEMVCCEGCDHFFQSQCPGGSKS